MDLIDSTINRILNPEKVKRTIHRYGVSDGKGYITETNNGTRINAYGSLEELEVNTTFIDMLDDGTPINDKGIVQCKNCGAVIHIDSVRECERCKKKICVLCARQKKNKEIYYCSLAHQLPFLSF